jgi:hypothetical protein
MTPSRGGGGDAWPILPRAPLSRILRAMAGSAAERGRRLEEGGAVGGPIAQSGRRTSSLPMIPAAASAALSGTGFGSMKSALKSG